MLRYQKEPQSHFWDHTQITLHTTVAYYKCYCEHLITEYIYHVTPDKTHDWKAVDHFTKLSIEHLKQKGVEIKKIHEFMDQAPNQYKSCTIFNHLSECHIPVCHHYLGPRHGKLSADHGSGIFKQWYTREMLAENTTVQNAFDLAKEAEVLTKQPKGESCMHFQTKVMYVQVIDRKLEDEGIAKAIPETRLIHAVRSLGTPGLVKIRHFDCCCQPCIHNTDNCTVKQADDWQVCNKMK